MIPDLKGATWRKASYSSGQGGNCVEVALTSHVAGVRDSKNPGPALAFSRGEVAALVAAVKGGRFDG